MIRVVYQHGQGVAVEKEKTVTENNYACKDNLWARCGALGDALRRASEAERKVEELEGRSAAVNTVSELAVAQGYGYLFGYLDKDED